MMIAYRPRDSVPSALSGAPLADLSGWSRPILLSESLSGVRGTDEARRTAPEDTRARHAHSSPSAGRGKGVLIVDDCALFRESLAAVLMMRDVDVVATAWDLPSLVMALDGHDVCVIVMNIATRGTQLLLRAAADISPAVRVIAIGTWEDDEAEIVECAEAGVAAYHMRSDTLEDLLHLIEVVAQGISYCPPRVIAVLLRRLSTSAGQPGTPGRDSGLTAREIQVLEMLELGMSNRDIAARLHIAVHTVKNHVHSVLTKLDVSTRAQAATLSRTVRYSEVEHRD